jgi:hypothetical protein
MTTAFVVVKTGTVKKMVKKMTGAVAEFAQILIFNRVANT